MLGTGTGHGAEATAARRATIREGAEAAAAARIIEQRLVEAEANVANLPVAHEVDEGQEEDGNISVRLEHPAQSDSLDDSLDDDDDDDYYDVVR